MSDRNRKAIIGRIGDREIEYISVGYLPEEFSDESSAVNWLIQAGYNPDDFIIKSSIGVCKRCGSNLYRSDIPQYHSQCFECDEDFYDFEQETEK